jgi:aldehyde dehydrogenase (NAD+)
MPYEDLDEVIRQIKKRPKPLSLCVFTQDERIKKKVLQEVSFGGGCVNEALMHIANSELPFGGVGDSGTGSYHGEAGFRAFSHLKSILDKEVTPDPDVKYSPHTEEKLKTLKTIVGD